MAKRTRRRRRSWSRLLLLVVFVAAALYAGYFCLFRPPEVPAETTRPDEAEEVSAEDTAQDAEALAQAVEERLKTVTKPITVAVMGCPVNGPGEASAADVGIAGGNGKGLLFRHGKVIKQVPQEALLDELMALIEELP